jgi:hypothetical protein
VTALPDFHEREIVSGETHARSALNALCRGARNAPRSRPEAVSLKTRRSTLLQGLAALATALSFGMAFARAGDSAPSPRTAAADDVASLLAREPALAPRQGEDFSWITPDVVLGARPEQFGYDTLSRLGIGAVLSLRGEVDDDAAWLTRHRIAYKRVLVSDYEGPSNAQMADAVAWIRENVAAGRRVYVHCRAGIGRSATVVAGWLASERGWDERRAWGFVRARRPVVDRSDDQRASLARWVRTIRRPARRGLADFVGP